MDLPAIQPIRESTATSCLDGTVAVEGTVEI